MHCVRLLHGAQPNRACRRQHALAVALVLDGLLRFVRPFLGLLGLFISFVGGLSCCRRDSVCLVRRFGLGVSLLVVYFPPFPDSIGLFRTAARL